MDAQPHTRNCGLSGRALGLTLIFLTAIIWVAASFVSQLLVDTSGSFDVSPFLLTYLSTSIFTVFLPLVQLKSLLQETWLLRRTFKYKALQEEDNEADALTSTPATGQDERTDGLWEGHQQHQLQEEGFSLSADLDLAEAEAAAAQAAAAARASAAAHKEAFTAAAQCFALWFTAQYLFNKSLSMTSVTSNTILSSTSSLFTFALSMVVLQEPYSLAKLLSIAACIGGTLLVTLSDEDSYHSSSINSPAIMGGSSIHSSIATNATADAAVTAAAGPSHSVLGDMLCLVSACFYASYTIVLRKSLPDDDEANVALFFGYIGLLCSVVFAPVVAVLAGLGTMHLKTIPPKAYLIILVEGVLNYCLSDYLWAHAVLLLGPTIATLGLSVQIPVAAVVEAIIGVPKWLSNGRSTAMMLSGTALIMLGFFAGNLAGGGKVYGSHHRGDMDNQQQQRRRSNMPDGNLDGTEDDGFQDLAFENSAVVIPVSTHASSGPRLSSPSFGCAGQQQQQQQRPISPLKSPVRKGAYNALASDAVGIGSQQRLSIELSSVDGSGGSCRSTPSSTHDSIEVPQGFSISSPRAVAPTAAVSEKGSSQQPSPGSQYDRPTSIADSAVAACQQPSSGATAVGVRSSSPARLRGAAPVARLGQQSKAGHYSD